MEGTREVVLDASVIAKWFVEEENSERALELRDRYISGEIEIIAPELLPFEVLNALHYKGLFTEDALKDIAKTLEAYSFRLFPLNGNYAQTTMEVACRNHITIYDASYLALAVLRNTHLYTADQKLARKLRAEYSAYIKSLGPQKNL